MPLRIPVEFKAEYRGQAKPGEFQNDAGETIAYGPKLKFEYEDPDGDVTIVPIGGSQLDRCEPPFDHTTLNKGDEVLIRGFVSLADRGSGRDSFMSVTTCEPVGARAKVAA